MIKNRPLTCTHPCFIYVHAKSIKTSIWNVILRKRLVSCARYRVITQGYVKSYIRNKNGLKSDVDIHLFDAKNGDKLPDDEKATLKECSLDGEKVHAV